jgi:hypothetical protein
MENALLLNKRQVKSQGAKFGSLDNSVFRNTLIFIHIAIGYLTLKLNVFATIWASVFIIYALLEIIRTANRSNFAVFASAYVCGLEIVMRALESPLPWELGKYATVSFLVLGMIVEKRKLKFPSYALIYFVLLLPSILVAEYESLHRARYLISFNLSGPLSLSVALAYFYDRRITKTELSRIILWFILPVCMMLAIIVAKMPSMAEAAANLQSKKEFSGGFGPNQVSVIMGFAFFLMALGWMLKLRITGLKAIDIGLAFVFLIEGFLTFSRGGVLTGIGCSLIAFFVAAKNGKGGKQTTRLVGTLFVFVVIGYFGWMTIDNLTEHSLSARYEKALGEGDRVDEASKKKGYDLSGRDAIFFSDLKIFAKWPITGVGPGCALVERQKMIGIAIIAHTEFSRLLAEHGMFGLAALLILIIAPYSFYKKSKAESRIILVSFTAFTIITMLHAAMRLGVIGFAFGLGFIVLTDGTKHALQRVEIPDEL